MKHSDAMKNIIDVHSKTSYYEFAARPEVLQQFWSSASKFPTYFNKLNLERVIELACGEGRHVPMYENNAGHIVLVDALEKNIDVCRKLYISSEKITFYANNGRDLSKLPSNSYTALFTYDAVVHFELIDVLGYLQEAHRVLEVGAYALFHHSNYQSNPLGKWTDNPHNRNFMSTDIFSHLADRAGFSIEEQVAIDWGENNKSLDAITLLKKVHD
jgi:ubiquinone/menaquinone biosynthesis C-methylase UbiE